ncbi:MAG TPA: ABC transporter permease [Verrucomicrobiae bacterium]|jgi:predicted permease|nr:ABC transporter permease [Verrucomicrobiae bacterium]
MQAGSIWKRFRRRLRYWLERSERSCLLSEEMEFHIASMIDELVAQGISEPEAFAAAYRKFGNMTQISEEAHFTWIARWMSDLAQDLQYAFRGMRRDAGFTAFTILIAGLGIGASSMVFSVVNALLLRPLPFRDPGRLVWIANGENNFNTQTEHYADFRELNQSFSDLAGWSAYYRAGDSELTGIGEPERLTSVAVTGNFFDLLGVQPAIGRSFTTEECQGEYSAPPAVLLNYSYWRGHFSADPSVVGRKLLLNNKPAMVVGVLPASFDFASIFAPGTPVDLFIPWPLTDKTKPQGNTMWIIGRLKPGMTLVGAQAESMTLGKQLESQHPERNAMDPRLVPLEQHVSGQVRPALFVLACAVGLVMLIVCANLSNLQLARLGARQKEIATRAALGAGRLRLLRQMLTETVALSCCGAVLGLLLAVAGTRELAHLHAFNLPLLESVRIDGNALVFTLLAAFACGVLFGLLPALRVTALSLREGMQDASRGSSGGKRHAWVRDGLVISELAFACILLVGAGLLIRSFLRVLDVNLGFQPERAAALRIDPSFQITSYPHQNTFIDEVLRRARSVPGIRAAGITDVLPLGGDRGWAIEAKGQVYAKGQQPQAFVRIVSDGYFEAAGIPLRSGRTFTERDRATSEPVVMINETMARTLWPGQNPLGQMITVDGKTFVGVVGVVADVRHEALEKVSGSEMYLAMRQTADYAAMELVVRTALPPDSVAAGLRTALRPLDRNLPVRDFVNLQDLVDRAVSPRRFLVLLLAGFAGFALILASLGIYAVISFSVSQRVQEIGIRMALGASPRDVQIGIVLRTLVMAELGLVLGMIGSRVLASGLVSLLFGITTGDPATFIEVGTLLIGVAAIAGYIPAWKASRIDPMVALRSN